MNLTHIGVAAVVGGALGWFAKWLHGATKLRTNELKNPFVKITDAETARINAAKDAQINAQAGRINLPK